MSKAFWRVFIPPPGVDWRQWIFTTDPSLSRARELAQTIGLLDRRIEKLPRDVWNIIIGMIYHGTLVYGPDTGSLVNWMEHWVTHPEQQRGVPLLIAPGTDESNSNGLCALAGLHHLTYEPIPNYDRPDCVVQYCQAHWEFTDTVGYYRAQLLRIGEFVMGVIVDDPKVLTSLTIEVNRGQFQISPFSRNCTAQMQTSDGKWVTFYYNPEIPVLPVMLPVLPMQYGAYVPGELKWNHTTVPPPVTVIYLMLEDGLRRNVAQSSHMLTFSNYVAKDGFLQIKS